MLTTAPFSPTRRKLHSTSLTAFSKAAKIFGFTIILKKSEELYQPPPCQAYSLPSIDGANFNAVKHLTYQGSVIPNDVTVTKDLDNIMSKASSSFGRLSKRVWHGHSLYLSMEIHVYRAFVGPTLLYVAVSWVLYLKQIRLPELFH